MLQTITKDSLFHEYYAQWIKVYKEGAIRSVTMNKYKIPTCKRCMKVV